MSMHSIFRRYAPIAFTLTVAGSALATERGYRDLLVRAPVPHAAPSRVAVASNVMAGYRNTAVLPAHAVTPPPSVAAPARGYRDLLVRVRAPSTAPAMQMALR